MIGKMPVKKLVLIILAVLLSAAVLDLLWWFISPGEAVVNQPGDVFNLDLTQATPVNCVFDASGHHTPANGDPQLVFSLSQDREVKSVTVRLRQPLRRKGYVQVYYGIDEITEINSVSFSAKAGTREFYFNLPGDKYASLRLDINADCWLDSVSCSDQPASFLRIPPFRPLRILTVAVVLGLAVFFFSRPKVRKCVRTLDHDWINPETRKPVVTVLYAVFAMAMLLHHIVVTLWYPGISKGTDIKYLRILFPFFAFVSIPLGHMWKDKGFWFLFALLLLEYLRLAIPTPVIAMDFSSILYAFFGCYSIAKVLGTKKQKPFLQAFCVFWCLSLSILCLLGIYSTLSQKNINNFDSGVIYLANISYYGRAYRLSMFYPFVISGIISATCFSISLTGFTLTSSRKTRLFYIIICVISLLATCFTNTRTSYVQISFSISILIFSWLYKRFQSLSLVRRIIFYSSFLILTVTLYIAISYIPDCFGFVRRIRSLFLPNAFAEETSVVSTVLVPQANNPIFSFLNTLSSGRIDLWRTAIQYLKNYPVSLFFGNSIHEPMSSINSLAISNGLWSEPFSHMHNLWLQSLIENGILGLFLLISFQVYFIYHALRLLRSRELPLWQRYISVPAVTILFCELTEYSTSLNACYPQATILYLFMGFTVAIGSQTKKRQSLRNKSRV